MAKKRQYIAVDLGAESGRVFLGSLSSDELELQQMHRFSNCAIEQSNSLRWDFEKLFAEVKTGITKAVQDTDGSVAGIGVDSWGVDFGLLDSNGRLIENPYHYRDGRTNDTMEKAFELMPKRQIYDNSGLQFLQFNTIYQLLAMRLAESQALAKAKKLIFMADLVSYFLSGKAYAEYTLAGTSQLMDMRTGQWSKDIFERLELPIEIMPDVVKPGTIVGRLSGDITNEIGCRAIPVIAVSSHDTASAVASVPAEGGNWAYISSGTWSLCGVEVPQAIINDKTFKHSFTNEGGVENTIRLLKNIMGLWLVQQCRKQWQKEGQPFSYAELAQMAEKAKAFTAFIDPNDNKFLSPDNMPEKINSYLAGTGRKPLNDKGVMIRTILESLALKYRWVLQRLEEIIEKTLEYIHVIGGGAQNQLLCQFTANATGKKVIAGPVEATAAGNILMQARATGQIKSLTQARQIVRNSFVLKEYQPKETAQWQQQYKKFENLQKS